MKHAMRSLHHLSVDADMLRLTLNGKDMSLHADKSAAPYLNLSECTRLKYLALTVDVTRGNRSCLCTPVIEVLSHVTTTQISKIAVDFCTDPSRGEG